MTHPYVSGFTIPRFHEINSLSPDEQRRVMRVNQAANTEEELLLRDVFVWAIVTRSSDVHVTSSASSSDQAGAEVKISVRMPDGMRNIVYSGPNGKRFGEKLFGLCNVSIGASTPASISTRFSMRLPAGFAARHGLPPPKRDSNWYEVDIRVEYIRTLEGGSFVARLLDQQRTPALEGFDMPVALRRSVMRAIQQPMGLFLVTGPTGSGKSTLLNALLQELNDGERSIITIERPVEYRLMGSGPIKQIEVAGEITWSRALTASLRLDPDVILVGELNDVETMQIALQAAQTGHLVLATLHANTAVETVSRALGLLQPRDYPRLAETLKYVLATRLLSRHGGETAEHELSFEDALWLTDNGMSHGRTIRQFGGPKAGKVSAMEAFSVDHQIRQAIVGGGSAEDIYRAASQQLQYETLPQAGVRCVQSSGAQLAECRMALGRELLAKQSPPLRMRLADALGISLAEASDRIDSMIERHEARGADAQGSATDFTFETLLQELT